MSLRDDVLRISKLARIKIPESDLPKVEQKFAAILDHFRFLEEAETDGVEPLFHAAEQMELRPDEPENPLPVEDLLRNAPEQMDSSFKIPRVVGGEE